MTVAVIGLGIMGRAFGRNLISAGVPVRGVDPTQAARERLILNGGEADEKLGAWIADCELIILSLASSEVLLAVTSELAGLIKPGQVILETGTFAMADKLAAQKNILASGAVLLDCPVSGTGAQADVADLVVMASGPSDAIDFAKPFMAHFSQMVIEAGAFGSGTLLKFVANHVVALHNCVAAEALNYVDALGLDRNIVYDLLSSGAGQSRMLELRMPLMISGAYEPPTASLKMFEKDLSIIGADIASRNIQTPLFDEVCKLYEKASATLPETHDTASVFEIYKSQRADK